jgi:hypothetical protein
MPNIQPLLGTLHLHFLIFFCIDKYKSKSGSVLQECRGYGYVDMMQLKKLS